MKILEPFLRNHTVVCNKKVIFIPVIRIYCAWVCSPQIESETSNSEKDLNEAMARLGTLGREINALKTKRANNSMTAARAEETATMARDKANEARQV